MGASAATTVFVNRTGHKVRMQVGNNQYFSDLASIEEGGEYKLHVNMNDTYREFAVSVQGTQCKKEIVSSDDCCDFQCITIQELGDGKIELLRQPREQLQETSGTTASKKPSWFSWRLRLYTDHCNSPNVPMPATSEGARKTVTGQEN